MNKEIYKFNSKAMRGYGGGFMVVCATSLCEARLIARNNMIKAFMQSYAITEESWVHLYNEELEEFKIQYEKDIKGMYEVGNIFFMIGND